MASLCTLFDQFIGLQ